MKTKIKLTGRKHEVKCWPSFFGVVQAGLKTFEVRQNDRDYKTGDVILQKEWDPNRETFTGRETEHVIGYVLDSRSKFVPPGCVIFGLLKPEEIQAL